MAKLKDLFRTQPKMGGVALNQIDAPYGLRSYRLEDGTYGGEMMPKGDGWLGHLPNKAHGGVSTELSIEDESGMFPSIVPTLTKEELEILLSLKDDEKVPRNIALKARKHADEMRRLGRSPFREIWEK